MQFSPDVSSEEETYEAPSALSTISDLLCALVERNEKNQLIDLLKLHLNLDETNIIKVLSFINKYVNYGGEWIKIEQITTKKERYGCLLLLIRHNQFLKPNTDPLLATIVNSTYEKKIELFFAILNQYGINENTVRKYCGVVFLLLQNHVPFDTICTILTEAKIVTAFEKFMVNHRYDCMKHLIKFHLVDVVDEISKRTGLGFKKEDVIHCLLYCQNFDFYINKYPNFFRTYFLSITQDIDYYEESIIRRRMTFVHKMISHPIFKDSLTEVSKVLSYLCACQLSSLSFDVTTIESLGLLIFTSDIGDGLNEEFLRQLLNIPFNLDSELCNLIIGTLIIFGYNFSTRICDRLELLRNHPSTLSLLASAADNKLWSSIVKIYSDFRQTLSLKRLAICQIRRSMKRPFVNNIESLVNNFKLPRLFKDMLEMRSYVTSVTDVIPITQTDEGPLVLEKFNKRLNKFEEKKTTEELTFDIRFTYDEGDKYHHGFICTQ
ncbi:DgyrCDS5273 [Dimorphilus gyrociliatus]|uniref:DgyrCDS5273 n=1 Tax=Dimorphilus gyrociliatus TaxID=2664684 RepID=A0A7I8VJE0_9ANNE|nr:DgyrCDS5273 [Dimorphilus gyrociliatus]